MIRLLYTQYSREFVCKIENIDELTVTQLHQLEAFASQRSGKLDYVTESIMIPKRIELHHLQELFKLTGIDVFITEQEFSRQKIADTATINFGKFKGSKWTELDEDYLRWLSKNLQSEDRQTALDELASRASKKIPKRREEVIMFGKHKGEKWDDLPTAYLLWVSKNLQGEAQQIALDVLAQRK